MNGNIKKQKLLLVEGIDEINFFKALFANLAILDIQVIESKGKDQFPAELNLIVNDPNFVNVNSIGIVRDADNSQMSAIQSIRYNLEKHGLPKNANHGEFDEKDGVKVGIFIAPGFKEDGMLESLVLESLKGHPVKEAADHYINNLRSELESESNTSQYKFPNNEAKARMHAFLSGMEKFVPSLGIASTKGYFDLNSEVFNDIKEFLRKI
jgi:hypothetical protein